MVKYALKLLRIFQEWLYSYDKWIIKNKNNIVEDLFFRYKLLKIFAISRDLHIEIRINIDFYTSSSSDQGGCGAVQDCGRYVSLGKISL